ncbi:Alpha/Beta hydrolase protein [Aspergillus alliaceus]|uniref:Kynurenine formamidase n=1 Tax=Petromyces alliaceus TaxID=209559 RepID=A0A5N7CJR4_PETAA|nr:Alpha/Beta hydrolase protein [Aspergillus alliaceus]
MPTETFSYGEDHDLQTVTVTTLSETSHKGYWIILIHGGAWRDPDITSLNFANPAESLLASSPTYAHTQRHIAAFASISYRLSPTPNNPQNPLSTNPREYRGSKHPDHINDVQSALAFLQREYGFGEQYILVGHSCGGTLAFQSVMGRFSAGVSHGPVAVLSLSGIYDLKLLRDTFKGISVYQDIGEGAFGADEAIWDAVSPAVVLGKDGVEGGWGSGRLAVLAYSSEDSLVDAKQWEVMRTALLDRWVKEQSPAQKRSVEMLSLKGQHDECWETGEELARAIAFTVEKLQEMISA